MKLVSMNRLFFDHHGFTLIGILVSCALLGILCMAFFSMLNVQGKMSRNIAARAGVTDLSHAIDLLLSGNQCDNLGTTSFSHAGISPVSVMIGGSCSSASGYCLSLDTLRFLSGSIVITSLNNPEIWQMIHPNSISEIMWTGLGSNTSNKFPFEMKVSFESSVGPPPLPIRKFVTISTDPAQSGLNQRNVIGMCQQNSPAMSANTIFCSKSGPSGSFFLPSDVGLVAFTGADCGGTLPDSTYVGVLTKIWVCAGTSGVAVIRNGTTDIGFGFPAGIYGPGIAYLANGGPSYCAPGTQDSFEVLYSKM